MGSVDPMNPCSAFKATTCQKVGSETIDGHNTEKWEMKSQDGKLAYVWVDPKLPLGVKYQSPDGSVDQFRNIRVGPQPDSLFTVPPDYHKLQSPAGAMTGPPQQ